jgi:hypothetical protein
MEPGSEKIKVWCAVLWSCSPEGIAIDVRHARTRTELIQRVAECVKLNVSNESLAEIVDAYYAKFAAPMPDSHLCDVLLESGNLRMFMDDI